MAQANIGVVGLAVMGSNLARNLASREGNTVAVYNRTWARTETLLEEHPEANFVPAKTIQEFADSLAKPRTALIMVQAGKGTDAVIDELVAVFEPGDIIVDGGNALFTDTIRREKAVRETGINFVGAGISGGEEGALNGPSIMPGGSAEAWETLGPILKSIAAVAEGEPCVTHVGTDGAGHFVKMIHNGIEYADMQLIAEAYDLIRRGTGKSPAEIADIFAEWNKGELESYLIEITAEVLRQVDAETGKPLVDVILDQAGSKGTGVWTVQTALDLGIPVSGIAEAVFARSLSSKPAQRAAAGALPGPDENAWKPGDADAFIEGVRLALYASKVIAYSQGFDAIVAGAEQYGWDIKKGEIAKIWRGGCIIRARFLNRITEAYAADPWPGRPRDRTVLRRRDGQSPGRVAQRGGRCRARGHPRRPRSAARSPTTTDCAPTACPPPSCRVSATSLAHTPTSASTRTASSTRCGRVTARKLRPRAPATRG